MKILDEKDSNFLAKIAYETNAGIATRSDEDYFKNDAPEWDDLPEHSKNHWRKIVDAVFVGIGILERNDIS